MNIFVVIAVSICIFLLSYAWFIYCGHQEKAANSFTAFCKEASTPFLILGFLGCTITYFLIDNHSDAIVSLPYENIALFFVSALCFAIFCTYFSSGKAQYIALLCLCLLNAFLLPTINITEYLLPVWAEKLILAVLWSIFAQMYFIINGVDGVASLQSLSISLGLMILAVMGMLPIIYGCYSGIFIALFLAFSLLSNYPATLTLTTSQSRFVGLLIGWLGLLATIENAGSCFIILSMYYIYETIVALFKKLSFQNQFKSLSNNTFYALLANAGISPKNICEVIARIDLVMILLACFQMYSSNEYTVPVVAFFMVFWLTSKIISPEQSNSHILLTGNLLSLFRKSTNKKEDD